MPEDEEYDIDLERELDRDHLLALVLQFDGITQSAAETRLSASHEKVNGWVDELVGEGMVSRQELMSDTLLEITDKGRRRLAEIGRRWATQGMEEEKEEKPPEKPKPKPAESMKKLAEALKSNRLDIILALTLMSAVYLLKEFLTDPNMEALSFLLAALMLSAALVLYALYKRQMKTRKFLGFLQWLVEKTKQRRKYLAAASAAVLLIYAVGMLAFDPPNKGLYVLLAVVFASTGILFYSPPRDRRQVLYFYLGITLLTYGLLLVVDWVSVTRQLFAAKSRIVDFIVGLGLILFVYFNEDTFGVRAKKLLELH